MCPRLGAANTAYARSVVPETIQANLPDPGLIFDSMLKRSDYREHPNKVSSMLYYWAAIITHDLFQTNHLDSSLSQTSSYLDLSVLYGNNEEEQKRIRTFKDGKLKPDCFSAKRLHGMPPATGVILIMFNRFHNHVAEQLALINENGRFTKPQESAQGKSKKTWSKYDNDLFQTARLVTCGLYMNITLMDYLRTITNLNRTNSTWSLDPRTKMGRAILGMENAPRGTGNQVSAEFNLVYRWHSNVSAKDEKWTDDLLGQIFGKPDISTTELLHGLHKWVKSMDDDPFERSFNNLTRGPDGKFDDGELTTILADAIEDPAGASGANHVPECLRIIEVMGIEQTRAWRCATLNEFRNFFGLKPHETFEDINPDPYVSEQLRSLYNHPDLVEIYPGIVVESDKQPMVPGVGICPTFTISRAILTDAVTLVRSDRFYTTEYHANGLTNWGYAEAQYDVNVEQGCVFYKLFLRAFPHHFKTNSIYAHYPLTVPSENHKIMTSLGRVNNYDYSRPALVASRINLTSFACANFVLNRPEEFKVTWGPVSGPVKERGGLDFIICGDVLSPAKQKRKTLESAICQMNWHNEIKDFYEHMTLKLLHESSSALAGSKQVDITRDVGNMAQVLFAAKLFNLPLKTPEQPKGMFTPHETYAVASVILASELSILEPAKAFPITLAAEALGQELGKVTNMGVKLITSAITRSKAIDGGPDN